MHRIGVIAESTPMLSAPRILIVKLSSLGDVINTLPIVDDIRKNIPGAKIDWVVERPCDALLGLHSGIDRVVPLELRRYRKERRYWSGLLAASRSVGALRARRYDVVIDLQGRMKSAIVAWLARGPVTGPAPRPGSEPHYHRLYRVAVERSTFAYGDAVSTNRALCARALGYPVPMSAACFGLRPPLQASQLVPSPRFAVMVHGSSKPEKCWPEEHWIELGRALARRGIASVLPWGDAAEGERAQRITAAIDGAVAPSRLVSLVEWAGVLAAATLVVGVDSGLTHLAAACGAPTVAIFTATRAKLYGIQGDACRNLGDTGVAVRSGEVIEICQELLARSEREKIQAVAA